MTATETYRERLAAAIADKYGSHLQFLKASGVYPSTLYHYLEGRRTPTLDMAERLANEAGAELWELLAPADVVERERKRAKQARAK